MSRRYIFDFECRKLIARIKDDILASDWTPKYIIGLTRGGLYPALHLSHHFDITMYSLNVSLSKPNYRIESNSWMIEDAHIGVPILIVDDINDSGKTIKWIEKDWSISKVKHNNVRFATIIDNVTSMSSVDYCGEQIDKSQNDQWIVFPWEHKLGEQYASV